MVTGQRENYRYTVKKKNKQLLILNHTAGLVGMPHDIYYQVPSYLSLSL